MFAGRLNTSVVGIAVGVSALAGFGAGALIGAVSPGDPRTPEPSPGGTGPVAWADVVEATASCHSDPSLDASGDRVTYEPKLAVDGDDTTAWRCQGDGVGETLRLDLGRTTQVSVVGIVPGYAKTDPRDKTDRYAENRRLSSVRWTFDDGTSVVQELDTDEGSRALQVTRVPPVQTRLVEMHILGSDKGRRNTVAVSTVRVGS